MQDNNAVAIPSTKELKDALPEEAEMYQRLKIKKVLAVPIKPRPTGFLVVRNLQRYINRSSMLQMLAFVLLSSFNEQKLMQSMKMSISPDNIKRNTDVIINLHRYAAQTLAVDPGSGTAHYWLIYAMAQRGADELAKNQVQIAQKALTNKDYDELVGALRKVKITSVHNLFHKGK